MPVDPRSGVHFELHGAGRPLMIGLPLMASHVEIFGPKSAAILTGYLDRLTDVYQVLTLDYPSIGRSADIAPDALTADRVCQDLLSVADAAGFDRFAFWGYSWSGAVGLQLAARTDRLSALVIGGWPALGAPYAEALEASTRKIGKFDEGARVVLRNDEQYAQWSNFYRSVLGWPETAATRPAPIPRMIYFGGDGDLVEAGVPLPIASRIRASRPALAAAGWTTHEIPHHGHEVAHRPDLVVPPVRHFLDRHLGTTAEFSGRSGF
ncbi:alpha/beta fold hydrolase [Allosphingosinicella indica]|uniref:Pimeloyl-ACP methyl ester carboxylesterase n=1 Tax=Allosphingosinicella indica TaxID=941907 RepID=A0A1X7FZJ6_9SPHN|nr:alpha/beta hydrolase [Allosphingosinicella indica]SMF61156.1 Pimeloyl-ACP methyl ester carboxylesterase [Allosphingosinicella indica]